jgi:hypothetical protein
MEDGGAGIRELEKFQEYVLEYRIVVYAGLNCKNICDGKSSHPKELIYCLMTLHAIIT